MKRVKLYMAKKIIFSWGLENEFLLPTYILKYYLRGYLLYLYYKNIILK